MSAAPRPQPPDVPAAPAAGGENPAKRADRLDPAVVRLCAVLVVGALAPLLDSTVVNVALHTLGRDLDAPVGTVQWVVTGYLLALAAVIPVTGWTVARFGARRTWLTALLVFLAGSALCGIARDVPELIVFRVVQGVGGGLMLPVLQTLVLRAAGRDRIGRVMAVVTLPALVGPILGPVLGGLIAGHASWRWIFLLNVPLCALALLLAWRTVPADPPAERRPLDLTGLVLLPPALAAVVYGLARVGGRAPLAGFGAADVLLPLVAGVLLLAAFARHATRTPTPLLNLRLLRTRSFTASAALLFLSGFGLFGAMLLLPLYYQQVRGQGVIAAGLLLAPQGLGSLLARGAGRLTDRLGPRPVVLAATAVTALGTVPFLFAGPHTGTLPLSAALVLRGAGLSAANMAVMAGAFRDLEPSQIPDGSGLTRIAQQLGGSFGTALLAVLLERGVAAHSTVTAFQNTFGWALAFTLLAALPALLLPRTRRGRPRTAPARPGSRG